MKRALVVQKELAQIATVEDLTSVFEGIASLRLARIKNQVVASKQFFNELWQIYSQLRADPESGTDPAGTPMLTKADGRKLFLVITSEGSLSGDIDQKIIDQMLKLYDANTDIIVIGAHGATQLAQRKVAITRYFKLPEVDQGIDVTPIITEVKKYSQTTVFYQTYVSLSQQDLAKIDLISAVTTLSEGAGAGTEIISSLDYLFEPSLSEIVEYMESVMLGVALSQVILESKLAQYASRYNAMTAANRRAGELKDEMRLDYYRAKRAESDERLKEVINSLEKTG